MFLRASHQSWIRLDQIIEAKADEVLETVRLKLLDDEIVTVPWRTWFDAIRRNSWRVFPAERGTFLLSMCSDEIHRERILGWALDAFGHSEPVTANGVDVGRELPSTVEHPDGTVQDNYTFWDSSGDWLADMRADAERVREASISANGS